MSRTVGPSFAIALTVLFAYGCSSVLPLDKGHYPAQLDTGEVQVIDARRMDRTGLERVLEEHYLVGRYDVSIRDGDDFEQRLNHEVEKAKPRVLNAGGRVLMYTDNSELIAVMKRDARYAGAIGAITMYVMLRRM
jgi:uncharacterized protein YheU (UPF0270 family)